MCGIFGVINFRDKELEKARKALHTLSHRGPDNWGEYHDRNVYSGHRRLSILDLSKKGNQPMISQDGSVAVAVNGEIYNYVELKKDLEKDYHFFSSSDSEVILHGYIAWGIDLLLEKVDGMFSISIYDKKKNNIYLVRDRVGIKPLYFSSYKNKVVYGSELKAIVDFYGIESIECNYEALYDFLTYSYVPTPKTRWKNIYKLEPAHYLEIDVKTLNIQKKRYWIIPEMKKDVTTDTAREHIRLLVEKSVKEQMVSDVPVGFFLSGGIDSGTLVSLAAKIKNNIKTFTIGFDDEKKDETHFAKQVAELSDTDHFEKKLDVSTVKKMMKNMVSWYDEPFADTSCFPTFLVSEYARQYVKVVLTGDGGDEVFGGYKWYDRFNDMQSMFSNIGSFFPLGKKILIFLKHVGGKLGAVINRLEQQFFLSELELYTRLMGGMLKEEKKKYRKLFQIPKDYDDYWYFRKHYRKDLKIYDRLQYLDFHTYLPDDILTKLDRVSMAVSLEARVPFLSREIIEYSFSLQQDTRLIGNQLKGILKSSMNDFLPDNILKGEKKGFSIPQNKWKNHIYGQRYHYKQEYILKEVFGIGKNRGIQ